MELGDMLRETLSVDCDEARENECTPMPQGIQGASPFDGATASHTCGTHN